MSSDDATLYGEDAHAPPRAASAPVDMLRLERGTSIGRYVVVEKLGQGGMGVVYAAYDPQLDRKVAFKLLHSRKTPKSTEARQEKQDRLLREAQALARIAHANVIAVHDVGTFEGHIFVAMEYLEGEDLQTWAKRDPGWEAILSAYIKAGRGLQAAHKSGLVHRDFKPENAFRCTDGRVKVLDFGLAHVSDPELLDTHDKDTTPLNAEAIAAAASTGATIAGTPPRASLRGSASSLSIRMTKPGSLLGTPAFMAPEQWDGAETDARSDQFSFCAALYEGVYGQRPFRGDTVPSLAFNIRRGEVQDPPPNTKVPSWLRRAILRGLEVEPDKRWPSMAELLHELERDRSAPRRRLFAGVAALGVLGSLWGYQHYQDQARAAACKSTDTRLEAQWTKDARARVDAAMQGTKLSYAEDTSKLVDQRMKAYAKGWDAQRLDACEDTKLRGEQSEKAMDLRVACLDRRRAEFDTLVEIFAEADAKVVEKAAQAIESLSSLEGCADVEALLSGLPEPSDQTTADAVEAIRHELARARTLRSAGKYKDAMALAKTAAERAESVDYPPVLAEAILSRGQLAQDTGAYEQAEADLERAVWMGTAHKHDQVTLRAANSLLSFIGFTQQKPEAAKIWERHAEAMLERVGGDLPQAAQLANGRGNLFLAQQDFETASEYYKEVLRLREEMGNPAPSSLGGTYGNLGTAALELGDNETGKEYFDKALTLFQEAYGPRHPSTAKAYNNLGIALERMGEYAAAIEHQTKALEIKRELLGDKHPSVAGSLGNLANVHSRMDDHEGASRLYRQALEIFRASVGDDHPYVGRCHDGIGKAELALENWDEAQAQLERALDIFSESESTERNLAATRFMLAQALRGADKEPARAQKLARQSLEWTRKAKASGKKGATEGDIDETIAQIEAFLGIAPDAP